MPDTEPTEPEQKPPETAPEVPDQPDVESDTSERETEPETEAAVDDIAAQEHKTPAAEDAKPAKAGSGGGWKTKLKALAKNRKVQAGAAAVLILVFALPVTRYAVLGLAIKEPVTVSVLDSKTNTPVSGASVSAGGASGKTDGNGKVTLKSKPGKTSVKVTKQYYKDGSQPLAIGLKKTSVDLKLEATGRLVPVSVVNSITGKPLANVQVKVLNTTAKTDAKGKATIALPTTADKRDARLSLSGYNDTLAAIQVTDKAVKTNELKLTPSGQVYFLSNLSGKLDVVKANLDGSNRKVVLEGTGKEDAPNTSLLASRDWKFLVLKSRRDTDKPALYLIDTSNDKTIQFDSGDAEFNLVGWAGHDFVYDTARNNLQLWQSGREALKGYDADHQQLNLLDQNGAEGDQAHYRYQAFGTVSIIDNLVVYPAYWNTSYGTANDKNAAIRGVQADGQNKKDYKTFGPTEVSYISAVPYEPQSIYFQARSADYQNSSYYEFEDQTVKTASIDDTKFNAGYPTFLLSPTGKQTFWTELRDGKNALFLGDAKGANKKQVATLSEFSPYGWFSDSYTLVSKNSSELYILPAEGLAAGQQPLKITDYYKPAVTYRGYGGGYGGL